MAEELDACPFCVRSTYLEVVDTSTVHYVKCNNCFARGPEKGCKEAAIEAWNGRV